MTSVAIRFVNCIDGKAYGNTVEGFDIGYELENVTNMDIQGGELNVNQQGIKGTRVKNSQIKDVKINQIRNYRSYKSIQLIDLIEFVVRNSYLKREDILRIYEELNRPLNETVFKEKR